MNRESSIGNPRQPVKSQNEDRLYARCLDAKYSCPKHIRHHAAPPPCEWICSGIENSWHCCAIPFSPPRVCPSSSGLPRSKAASHHSCAHRLSTVPDVHDCG